MTFGSGQKVSTITAADRAFAIEAYDLRLQLAAARAPSLDRSAEILSRLTSALTAGEQRDGTRVDVEVFQKATDLLRLLPADVPLPRMIVESEQEIGLDWDYGFESVLSFTVDVSDRVGYSGVVGGESSFGRIALVDSHFPPTLLYFLQRLHDR